MANIQPQIDDIRKAILGRDVREAIASGLEAMNAESSEAIQTAATAQDSALNSALQAAQSETNAANSASAAQQAAQDAAGTIVTVEGYKNDAQQAAQNAAGSQTAAKASEDAAKDSENNAKASEQIVTNGVATVNQAVIDARQSATDASNARSQAQTYAQNAQTASTTAANSQTQSAINATNAANSAAAAEQYAQQAAAASGIEIATSTKVGIVKSDGGVTTEVNQFGTLSVPKLPEHTNADLYNTGAHGTRIKKDDNTEISTFQRWDENSQEWRNIVSSFVDEEAILYASGWQGTEAPFTYDLGIETTYDAKVFLKNTATNEEAEAAINAQIAGNGNDNILRAWGEKPEVNIPIVVRKAVK